MNDANSVNLIGCEDRELDKGRIYYISDDGKRHWIPGPDIARGYGWNLKKVEWLPYDEILKHPISFSIAPKQDAHRSKFASGRMIDSIRRIPIGTREFFGGGMAGIGLEFSVASNPWPFGLECEVYYADPFDNDEGCKVGYENKDYVPLDFKASLEDMSSIEKKDFDFICCSHVIEHTPRVLLALKNVYEHLKVGGKFFMAVPHMCHTFDKLRQLTTLEHHIKDFTEYRREDDIVHLVDYLENAHIKYNKQEANILDVL